MLESILDMVNTKENNKLPKLGKNNYDFYYENISFNIYDISENTLLVEQKFNDKSKIYFITTDCFEIKKLLN